MATLDAALKGVARVECKGPLKIHRIVFVGKGLSFVCSFDGYRFTMEISPEESEELVKALDARRIFPNLTEYPIQIPEPEG